MILNKEGFCMQLPARVYAEINLDAICQNVQNAMDKVGKDTKMMAIINRVPGVNSLIKNIQNKSSKDKY